MKTGVALLSGRVFAYDERQIPALEQLLTMPDNQALVPVARNTLAEQPARTRTQQFGSLAVIPVYGVITPYEAYYTGTSLTALRRAIFEALADPAIETILIHFDSPGGDCSLLPETADLIHQATASKRVVACVSIDCCSAAYWLASQCTEIIGTPSGQIGSVGCWTAHLDFSSHNEKLGVVITYIFAGRYKVEGNFDEPLSEEARAFQQHQTNLVYDQFVKAIARGREVSELTVRTTYGEGRVFYAPEALRRGMIDRIATLEEVLSQLVATNKSTRRTAALPTGAAYLKHQATADADAFELAIIRATLP